MKHLLSSITLLLLSTLAFGQVPNTFSSGETISSSKINANFAYVASAIKNDDITAMMVCGKSGFDTQDKFFYGGCVSTDNQTFSSNYFTPMSQSSESNYSNSLSLVDIFQNKWILFETKVGSITLYQNSYKPYEYHIFYKLK